MELEYSKLYILNSVAMDEFKIKGYFIDENRCENLVTLCFRGR